MEVLRNEEKIQFGLRSLYESYGYCRYKMSKFEEYDLYVKNRDTLISSGIITFTDTDGKLLALKPDVTLSIIKNSRGAQKVYYNENVYRVSKGTHSFKEIMQAGIEYIGDIDSYAVFEVLLLAAKSLESISDVCVLDISHLGIISELIGNLSRGMQKEILRCLVEKNMHELPETEVTETVKKLMTLTGSPEDVISSLYEMMPSSKSVSFLEKITKSLKDVGCRVNIDFSVSGDIGYYNGIVFKGFVKGVPECVLSGGQYDGLMKQMGKKESAIGFAIYLDSLERLYQNDKKYDTDAVVIYDDSVDFIKVYDAVSQIAKSGKTVAAFKKMPEGYRAKEIIEIGGSVNA